MGTGAAPGRTGVATRGAETAGERVETEAAVGAAGAAGAKTGACMEVTVDASSAACETTGEAVTGTLLRALRKASAVWKRSAGSLAIDIRIISFNVAGSPGWSSTGGLGASFTWAAMVE